MYLYNHYKKGNRFTKKATRSNEFFNNMGKFHNSTYLNEKMFIYIINEKGPSMFKYIYIGFS